MVKNRHRAGSVLDAFEVMVDQLLVDVTETTQSRCGKTVVTITKRSWDDIQSTPTAAAFVKRFCVSRDAFELLA